MHDIFRVLMGTVNVLETGTGKIVKLTENETRIGSGRSAKPVRLFNYLIGPEGEDQPISLDAFEGFLQETKPVNRTFFVGLQTELTLCLTSKALGRSTESFLYFYRMLEHMSLAFPLTYALIEDDFGKAHRFLKSLLANERDGDLRALNIFVPKIAELGGFSNESFVFSFAGYDRSLAKSCSEELKRCVGSYVTDIEFKDELSDYEFSIPFNSMHSFVVSLRNRMFHHRIGEANLNLSKIGGSEVLTDVVMREAVHWFTKIYSEIIRALINKSV